MDIISLVTNKVEELTQDSALFLVEIKMKPTNNIKVFVDGDNGLNIEACTKINRALYKMIEESELYPEGDFSLEVSSPGLDEPLKFFRQYNKNIGRTVEVTLNDETKHLGVLQSATEAEIVLEKTIGKKKEIVVETIPFETILKTVVQVVF
ncbi:ribosome maturation factor [Taibaiella sp. KBW10]|uniref:ribosome maturation factor RimP n=1 Tax=Taibaiella sp. KBW10 TaxID=2153357 RepID=UPI000F595819|nr:ribosome maturation factor [Taibaiella sp. KBW10]RQO30259.1 ribosome maturation factor [Taibaiella sp. KBW10]